MRELHLAALLASALLVVTLGGRALYAAMNVIGTALQQAALRQPDLLLIFGASEALVQSSPYQASAFFQNYPDGFETFEVAKGGVTSLLITEQIVSLGPRLKGKKVVISFAPSSFTIKMTSPDTYAGMFSRLHANELAFSDLLSFDTKQLAARRMLQYPKTLDTDPILRFALQNLARAYPLSSLLYYAVWPLGRLQTLILELQDHYQTVTYIASQKRLSPMVKHQPATIDYQALAVKALHQQTPRSNNNPYGIDDTIWQKNFDAKFKSKPAGSADKAYLSALENSKRF